MTDKQQLIFDAAYARAKAEYQGLRIMTRQEVVELAGLQRGSEAIVNHRWGSMDGLRDAVAGEALKREDYHIVACAIGLGLPMSRSLDTETVELVIREVLA